MVAMPDEPKRRAGCHFDFFEKHLSQCFRVFARYVSFRPWPFIVVPVLLTIGLSFGIFFLKNNTDPVYLYTPANAPSKIEQQVFHETWEGEDGSFAPGRSIFDRAAVQVIVTAKDRGNILRKDLATATVAFNSYITRNVSITVDGVQYSYVDMCIKWQNQCHENHQIAILSFIYERPSQYARLTYPQFSYNQMRHYIGTTLGGVVTDKATGDVVEAKAWQLIYHLRCGTSRDLELAALWMQELERRLLNLNHSILDVSFSHSNTLSSELSKNALYLAPKIPITFVILTCFTLLCTMTLLWKGKFPWIDWTRSTPWLAFAGVLGAAMGVSSTIGFLSLCGLEFCEVIAAMPFLVISVRLDNTFLMVSALFHTCKSLPVEDRISEALADAAVSITITVLTDILSFGVGYFTDFPAVQLFCIYTCVAMFVTFLYQLTFLLGLLVLHARNEQRGMHSLVPCVKTIPWKTAENRSFLQKFFCLGSPAVTPSARDQQMSDPTLPVEKSGTKVSRTFEKRVAPLLVNRWVTMAILIIYAIYLVMAIYGCFLVREGLEPVHLLVEDSYATKYYRQVEKYFNEQGQLIQVGFLKPGKLSDPENRRAVSDVVLKFANSPHGLGKEGVDFWLTAFENFLPNYNQLYVEELEGESFYDNLEVFFGFSEFQRYKSDVVWNRTAEEKVTAFRVAIGVRNINEAVEQTKATREFRALAKEHSEYDILTFSLFWIFTDQYQQVLPNVLQEMYSGMACMVVIALLLVPKPLCSLWVTFMIASIDVGVIGYMTFWDLSMDCISMITLIMSIGFSVDFSAHIAYAYTISTEKDSVDRIRFALGGMAWPIIQGGLATILGVTIMSTVNSYMVIAFCKTVFLVILIGVVHGIIILPVFLHLFDLNTLRSCLRDQKDSGRKLPSITAIEIGAAPKSTNGNARGSSEPHGLSSEPLVTSGFKKLTSITKKYIRALQGNPHTGASTNSAFVHD